jgi:hypothetical protein
VPTTSSSPSAVLSNDSLMRSHQHYRSAIQSPLLWASFDLISAISLK